MKMEWKVLEFVPFIRSHGAKMLSIWLRVHSYENVPFVCSEPSSTHWVELGVDLASYRLSNEEDRRVGFHQFHSKLELPLNHMHSTDEIPLKFLMVKILQGRAPYKTSKSWIMRWNL